MENTLKNKSVQSASDRVLSTKMAAKKKSEEEDDDVENDELLEVPGKNAQSGNANRTYLIDDDDEDDADLEDEEAWVEKDFEDTDPSLDDDFVPGESESDLLSLEDDDDDFDNE